VLGREPPSVLGLDAAACDGPTDGVLAGVELAGGSSAPRGGVLRGRRPGRSGGVMLPGALPRSVGTRGAAACALRDSEMLLSRLTDTMLCASG
jgi:hypothetical protein